MECLASVSCVGSALCSAADRLLMNNFGMCAGALQNKITPQISNIADEYTRKEAAWSSGLVLATTVCKTLKTSKIVI